MKQSAIGIDIGGTNLRVGLVSRDGRVLKRTQHPTGDKGDRIIATITAAIDEIADQKPVAIGISAAGIIDRAKGIVSVSPNLHAIEGLDFPGILGERYKLPVFVENDANLAALGERETGAGRDFRSFILITLGTGIGGGIIYKGELLEIPAEIGHMVVEPEGTHCECGNRGCLEEYAAAKAMIQMATSALEKGEQSALKNCCKGNIYRITPLRIYEFAKDGDALSREILRTAGKYLGIGIANLANIFHPDAFILTGGLTNAWDIYVEEAIREADRRAMKGLFRKESVISSPIKEDAGLIGAALFALKSIPGERI